MPRSKDVGALLVALVTLRALAGCASAPPPATPTHAHGEREAIDQWISAEAPSGPARSVSFAPAAMGPVAIHAAPPPEPARPRRMGKVNVTFSGADMVNAMQFLADAGRFNLVLESGLTGNVSASLRGVDPYDALVTLAEANGAHVAYDRQIVTVRHR